MTNHLNWDFDMRSLGDPGRANRTFALRLVVRTDPNVQDSPIRYAIEYNDFCEPTNDPWELHGYALEGIRCLTTTQESLLEAMQAAELHAKKRGSGRTD